MSQRATKADRLKFERAWLSERIPHEWAGAPTRCTHCGRKYGPQAAIQPICPKRKKPGRWRLHCRRAWSREQYPTQVPERGARWILSQIRELERNAKYLSVVHKRGRYEWRYTCPDEYQWWKYSRDARRYRALLRQWWALPSCEIPKSVGDSSYSSRWDALFTRGRNKLVKRAMETQQRSWTEGGTTYTFHPDATVRDPTKARWEIPLFHDEVAS